MTVAEPSNRFLAPASLGRWRNLGLAVGLVGLVLCALGWVADAPQFFSSWLLAVTYWVGVSIGCLALMMIHHLTGGAWGVVIRRVLEAAAAVLPLLAVLFVPLLFGLPELFAWARPEAASDPILAHKAGYLNPTAFTVRFVVYFALWAGLTFWLRALSARQDRAADPALSKRMQAIAAPGLVLWAFVTTFAFVDWLMSLEPHWFSTIYGVYFFGGAGLSAMGFLVIVAAALARREPLAGVLTARHFHDWGKLTLAFVLLWAYFAFSQFLIIWAGNLPEEISWYLHRTRHGWAFVGIALALFHFGVPFLLLLSRELKRRPGRLALLAGFILFMRWVDYLWQIAPAMHPERFAVHWLDVVAPLAVGGLWLATFVWIYQRRPVLPVHDPYLEESMGDVASH